MLLQDLIDHCEKGTRIEFGCSRDSWARDTEPFLQIFFISNQDVDIFHNAPEDRLGAFQAAEDLPEFGAIVQVEGDHRTGGLCRLHAFDDHLRRCFR